MPRYSYGGQALIEGVMMRGRDAIAVALRHPDGRIVWASERLDTGFHKTPISRAPFVRGLVILYETLVVGTRWLIRAAGLQVEDEGVEIGRGSVAIMLLFTAALGIGLFFLLPLVVATFTVGDDHGDLMKYAIEGLVRVGLFLGYLALLARTPDIARVFQYHGAEHMTIHALEAGDPLRPEAIRKYPTAHPRCGTEFLVVVILLSIIGFALVGKQSPLVTVASRILLIPVIASVGYELLRLGARHRSNPVVRVVMWPGILVQMITTKQPTDDMIEVAIVAVEEALRADGEPVPDGGLDLARDPMPAPGEHAARTREAADAAEAAGRDGTRPRARSRGGGPRRRPVRPPGRLNASAIDHARRPEPRHQARRPRGPVRRGHAPARHAPRSWAIPTRSAASVASCRAWSRSSRPTASSTTCGPSSTVPATCAMSRPTTR